MRDLFNQDRPMSPALIRSGTALLGGLFAIAAIFIVLQGFGNLFSLRTFLTGLFQLTGGLGLLLSLYLIVRLLGEAVMAMHRMNDRLTVMAMDLGNTRSAAVSPAEPDPKPAQRSRPAARKATPEPAKDDKTGEDS